MAMIRGPQEAVAEFKGDPDLNVALRLINRWDLATGQVITRFDILLNSPRRHRPVAGEKINGAGDQFNIALITSSSRDGALLIPTEDIIDGFSINASAESLIIALREIADTIERNVKARE